jgi:S1-C subfamily serine protease
MRTLCKKGNGWKALLVWAMLWVMPGAVHALPVKQVVKAAMPSVVEVHVLDEKGEVVKSGSGFVVRGGFVVTNQHVIEGATRARIVTHNGERVKVLGVRAVSEENDFAILQVDASNLPALAMGDSRRVETGDAVIALGSPLGLSKTTTVGIVSLVRRVEDTLVIQHTAPIAPGSSGGPLLNEAGRVIGINTAVANGGQGLFFAVPMNYVVTTLASLPAQFVTLRQMAASGANHEELRRTKAAAEFLEANFYRYEDPDKLFSIVLPKVWRVQRTVTRGTDGSVTILFMASDPNAERARLNGWLSAGLRIRFVLPPKGREWSETGRKDWAARFLTDCLKGYSEAVPADPRKSTWGSHTGLEIVVAGDSDQLSQTELASLVVFPMAEVLVAVEVAMPAREKEMFETLRLIFQMSFSLGS